MLDIYLVFFIVLCTNCLSTSRCIPMLLFRTWMSDVCLLKRELLCDHHTMSSKNSNIRRYCGEIIKEGTLRKLKSMKKKYFVLRAESGDSPACLEYYLNEKKFKANAPPRRVIMLKTCFNINQRKDLKQKNVIGLYYKSGCFCIVLDSEKELEEWLKALLTLQLGESAPSSVSNGEGEVKPTFEHVWMVTVMERDMGSKSKILGQHHLCLTDHSLTLVKSLDNDKYNKIEFSLQKIKACGHTNSFFYMRVGNDTVTGAGDLWMTTEDANIAETMHATIMSACQKCNKQYFRVRSQSYNESSKPPPPSLQRWPTHAWMGGCMNNGGGSSSGESTVRLLSPSANHRFKPSLSLLQNSERRHSLAGLTGSKDKTDGVNSRIRTTSEGAAHVPNRLRPWSMYNKPHYSSIHSQPVHNSSLSSPVSVGCSGDSEESVDDPYWDESKHCSHSLTPDHTIIPEEPVSDPSIYPNCPEDEKLNNYISMDRINVNDTSYHKISPHSFRSAGFKPSSPSQGSFGDTCSPSSSPLDPHGSQNYLPMSPGENRYNSHSRDSSITEENYVPMMAGGGNSIMVDDGYVDMNHGGSNSARDRCPSGCNTSTGSTSSLFSSDYHIARLCDSLDKVPSFITHEDDHGVRGTRAWSVGSRPNNIPSKTDLGSGECHRERAFSLGSKVSTVLKTSTVSNPPLSSSHSSVEPGEDQPNLMEMDFTKASKHAKSRGRKGDRGGSGLSPPKKFSSVFGRSPPKPSPASPPHPSPCLDRVPETEPGYLDMCPVVAPKQSLKPQAFPNTTYSPHIKQVLKSNRQEYLDMTQALLKRTASLVEDNNNSKVVCPDSYVEMNPKKQMSISAPESESDYMNMSAHGGKDSRYSTPIEIQRSHGTLPWQGISHITPSSQLSATLESSLDNDAYMVLQPVLQSREGDYMELKSSSNIDSLAHNFEAVGLGSLSDKNAFSDKEVQYASLDLPGCDFVDGRATSSQPLPYAKIDFVRSGCQVARPH